MFSTNSIQISYEETKKNILDYTPIEDKNLFRLSLNSQSSNTTSNESSSNRLSYISYTDEDYVTYCTPPMDENINHSSTSLSPSSRYLLSGHSTSENLRNKILSKFIPLHHQKSIAESFISTNIPSIHINSNDSIASNIDPWCASYSSLKEKAILSDWLLKYDQPSFAFAKTWRKRYFVLVDHILYTFKATKSTSPAKEHFLLTEDTFVFVTEEFKKGYTIELRKPFSKWYIRCDSVDQMRLWLEHMKKIVACVKIGYDGALTGTILQSIILTDDYRIMVPTKIASAASDKKHYRQSLPIHLNDKKYSTRKIANKRQSLQDIPNWQTTLPPQLPPPKSKPPPVPLLYMNKNLPTVSEDI